MGGRFDGRPGRFFCLAGAICLVFLLGQFEWHPNHGLAGSISVDSVSFGANPLSTGESLGVVLERALAKLQEVLENARAELGLTPNDPLDTSAEATANRIADFALGFFEQFVENHPELGDDEARQAFVDLIGGAVQQGVDEALGILEALSSLTPEVGSKVDSIVDLVQQRFDAFLSGA